MEVKKLGGKVVKDAYKRFEAPSSNPSHPDELTKDQLPGLHALSREASQLSAVRHGHWHWRQATAC